MDNPLWRVSHRCELEPRLIADRHYNRQHPGAANFVPPGRCFVLSGVNGPAVWVTSWPFAEYTKHAWAGAWVNSCFRNEGAGLSSKMILEAVAATRIKWPSIPSLGMITFVDRSKVKSKRDPGYCYLCAGFKRVGKTKGGLVALQLLPDEMPDPACAIGQTKDIFGLCKENP